MKKIFNVFKDLLGKVCSKDSFTIKNRMSNQELDEKLRSKLKETFANGTDEFLYIEQTFDGEVIYLLEKGGSEGLYAIAYNKDAEDNVELVGSPTEVSVNLQYVRKSDNTVLNSKGETTMEEREKTINALIENGAWTEDDREFLTGLEDDQLEKMAPIANKEEGKNVKPAEESAKKEEPKTEEKSVVNSEEDETVESYLEKAPAPVKEALASAVKAQEVKKAGLVQNILKADGNKFSEEVLSNKSIDDLEAIASLIPASADYSGKAGGAKSVTNNKEDNSDVAPLEVPSVV